MMEQEASNPLENNIGPFAHVSVRWLDRPRVGDEAPIEHRRPGLKHFAPSMAVAGLRSGIPAGTEVGNGHSFDKPLSLLCFVGKLEKGSLAHSQLPFPITRPSAVK